MSDAELDAWAAAVAADVDVVWTQWPDVGTLNAGVRSAARRLGGRWVHTVHNVHPHEADTEAILRHAHAYRDARGLVVHSRVAAEQLVGAYPATRSKVIESRLGLYSVYPRRPAARDAIRRQLGVAVDDRVVLIFGGIRPYKNIDAALEALRDPRCNRIVLVIAGWEWGYPEAVIGDRLGRSRRLVCDLGVADRVRLLPGPFGRLQSAELFEASDAALLPYLQGSGSALLLMAMSFRKPVVLTDAGGMHEYVAEYPGAIPLHGATAHDIAVGLGALEARDERFDEQLPLPAALKWPAIARETVGRIERLFGRTGPGAR
jgi:glycosyltransferase involved in cell wall biosynthesis